MSSEGSPYQSKIFSAPEHDTCKYLRYLAMLSTMVSSSLVEG